MPWVCPRDIVNLSKEFYTQMRLFYEELNDRNDIQRIRARLESVRLHVEHLEKEFKELQNKVPPEVLDSCFLFPPDSEEPDTNPTERIGASMPIEDVLAATLEFDSALSDLYQKIAESTESEDVRALFLDLKKSIGEEKKLANDALNP